MQSLRSSFSSLQNASQSPGLNQTHQAESLHLFRALLRQCTYLPDPLARSCLRAHVVSRFRDYAIHKPKIKLRPKRKPISLIAARRPALLKTARKGLLFLQRANHGHHLHLSKILAMAYGRVGKRRHELLKALKIPDVSLDAETLQKLSHPTNQQAPQPSKQFLALIKSQLKKKQMIFSRGPIKLAQPVIAEENSWGRPMPVKRVRNIKRRWYAESMDRIMPPLPQGKWEMLQKLVSGELQWEGPVQRRGSVTEEEKALEKVMLDKGGLSRPHALTPRYMKRLWGNIFVQSPKMKENASRNGGWDISWGDALEGRELALAPDACSLSSAFEGVDKYGRVSRQKQKDG